MISHQSVFSSVLPDNIYGYNIYYNNCIDMLFPSVSFFCVKYLSQLLHWCGFSTVGIFLLTYPIIVEGKTFDIKGSLIWFLTSMCYLVLYQVTVSSKTFVTMAALIRFPPECD